MTNPKELEGGSRWSVKENYVVQVAGGQDRNNNMFKSFGRNDFYRPYTQGSLNQYSNTTSRCMHTGDAIKNISSRCELVYECRSFNGIYVVSAIPRMSLKQ